MDNSIQQVGTAITPHEINAMATSLQSMGYMNSSKSKCCIYTVPKYIKNEKEKCYRPFVMSIGPVFCEDPTLKAMQEVKEIYSKYFIGHRDNARQTFEPYIQFVSDHESEIRECYEEEIRLPRDKFIPMIVLDATFVIYLIMGNNGSKGRPSCNARRPPLGKSIKLKMASCLERDLFLEENQLPFFVLKGIYNIAFSNEVHPDHPFCSFTDLALQFPWDFSILEPETKKPIFEGKKITDASNIQHLVHLQLRCCYLLFDEQRRLKERPAGLETDNSTVHCKKIVDVVIKFQMDLQRLCCCSSYYNQENEPNEDQPFHKFGSAKQLHDAGVKFELSERANPLGITFNKSNGVLKIPKLFLHDRTEPAWRSILFFEQCHRVRQATYFADYIFFLDRLIDTVDDVQVLQKEGILENILGSDEEAVNLFNKLTKNICHSDKFAFSNVSKELKDYASTRKNRWKAILWSRYFNHPWAIISVIYAVILLILTVIQTITAFTSK